MSNRVKSTVAFMTSLLPTSLLHAAQPEFSLPQKATDVCTIGLSVVRQREIVPGATAIQRIEQAARAAWADATGALEFGTRDIRVEYPKYLQARATYDSALAPLVDRIPVSSEGVVQFAEADSMLGGLARCIEKQGGKSATATSMRKKAAQLAPLTAALWQEARSLATSDIDFQNRVKKFSHSEFLNAVPSVNQLAAAGRVRIDSANEQKAAKVRERNAEDAAAIYGAIAQEKLAGIQTRQERDSRVQARPDAERLGRAAKLPSSTIPIRGLRLGTYPTPELISAAAEQSFGCSDVLPVRMSESGIGGERSVTAGCSALGIIGPYMSATYVLKAYRLVEVREKLWPGDYKICAAIDAERERTSFASRAREFERAGWRLVKRQPREAKNLLGLQMPPWQSNIYRQGNVTLELWEYDSRTSGGDNQCSYPTFMERLVAAHYTLSP